MILFLLKIHMSLKNKSLRSRAKNLKKFERTMQWPNFVSIWSINHLRKNRCLSMHDTFFLGIDYWTGSINRCKIFHVKISHGSKQGWDQCDCQKLLKYHQYAIIIGPIYQYSNNIFAKNHQWNIYCPKDSNTVTTFLIWEVRQCSIHFSSYFL